MLLTPSHSHTLTLSLPSTCAAAHHLHHHHSCIPFLLLLLCCCSFLLPSLSTPPIYIQLRWQWPGLGRAEEDRSIHPSMEGDDKWKFSKKGRSRSGRNYYSTTDYSSGTSTGTGTGGGPSGLSRSYSASVSSATRDIGGASSSGSGSSSSLEQKQQREHARLSKKCVEAVKEHRARFYIVRRCVSMLVCWRDY